jgi:hypothetical protein
MRPTGKGRRGQPESDSGRVINWYRLQEMRPAGKGRKGVAPGVIVGDILKGRG